MHKDRGRAGRHRQHGRVRRQCRCSDRCRTTRVESAVFYVKAEFQHRVLGSTVDDAAGECFDKVGKLLGLAYPAGPEMDRLAAQGNPRAHPFPRPMLHDPGDDFSFSGLKTAVRYFLEKNPALPDDPARLRDLCASVQAAIVDVLVAKTIRAALRLRVPCVTVSGGVACNSALRRQLARPASARDWSFGSPKKNTPPTTPP